MMVRRNVGYEIVLQSGSAPFHLTRLKSAEPRTGEWNRVIHTSFAQFLRLAFLCRIRRPPFDPM